MPPCFLLQPQMFPPKLRAGYLRAGGSPFVEGRIVNPIRSALTVWLLSLPLLASQGCAVGGWSDHNNPNVGDDDNHGDDDNDDATDDDDTSGDDDDTTAIPGYDDDGDGISNDDEGGGDNDGDGTPNMLDTDSDGDGVSDHDEAGDSDLATPPADSDGDGTADYLDQDSDGNNILDGDEGDGDVDGDGVVDSSDLDNDGDGIDDVDEIGGGVPPDHDGDGVDDYMDTDSDGDGIDDVLEGGDDADLDGTPNYLDEDADGDGLLDLEDGTSDPDGDSRPDFLDTDSDNDGIGDATDPNRDNRDTDGDGYSDLAEQTYGTSPTNASSHPGDDVFYAELEARVDTPVVVPFTPEIQYGDVMFLLDTTCSMSSTLNNVASYFSTVVSEASASIPDMTYGVSSFNDYQYSGYGSSGDKPFWLKQQQTTSTSQVQSALSALTAFGGNDTPESSMEALYQASSGMGYDLDCDNNFDSSVDVPPFIASGGDTFGGGAAGSYSASVPGTGTYGGAGFRSGAVPILVLATDASMRDADAGSVPPACSSPAGLTGTVAAMNAIGAKFIGVGTTSSPISKMNSIAAGTGSLADVDGDGASDDYLVFQTSAGNVAEKVLEGIEALTNSGTYDLSLSVDDPTGYGFVTNIDPVLYPDATSGETVTFTLTVTTNIVPVEQDQVFVLTLTVLGNGTAILDEMTLLIVVLGV